METLSNTIKSLIDMHQEGPYWDFKREWYLKEKDSDLLIDIICMANNMANKDAYIIVGVDEENSFAVIGVENDLNRRNTQMLTDFLRSKKFSGDNRPIVTVENLFLNEKEIDVIVIHNSLNTPFFLKDSYKGINANNIYVRLQDSNTPRNSSADYHHIEYLWKKRFGMLLTPIEKIKEYLCHPEDWENSPSIEDKKYYKYAPEYTIERTYEADDGRSGYEYYLFSQTDHRPHWCEIRVLFHQTVLEEIGGVILDGGRYFTSAPSRYGFSINTPLSWDVSYGYFNQDSINYLIHEFYYFGREQGESKYSHDSYESCLLIFRNEKEHQAFIDYAKSNWHRKKELEEGILLPYFENIPGYNVEVFKEQYLNVQILRKLLDEYRLSNC